jgi:cytochrome c553
MDAILLPLMLTASLKAQPGRAATPDLERGRVFWQAKMCKSCHGAEGEGGFGPDLAGRGLSLTQLTRAIRQPWGVMPSFTEQQVTDQNIADLQAWISTLPRVEQPGPWHWQHTPPGAPEGQRLQSTFGCSQCHEPELAYPRRHLGAIAKEADFAYFANVVYEHSEKYPRGGMGDFSRDRLPESVLREIFQLTKDAGFRVPMFAGIAAGPSENGKTTYTLTVTNDGVAGMGLAAEGVTIFVRVPPGCSVIAATGNGYVGVRPLRELGLSPALQFAPHPHDPSGRVERPNPDLAGNVAVWNLPQIAAAEKQVFSLTLTNAGTRPEILDAFAGSTVYWEKPGARLGPPVLVYRDLRIPDKGDHIYIAIPRSPRPASP